MTYRGEKLMPLLLKLLTMMLLYIAWELHYFYLVTIVQEYFHEVSYLAANLTHLLLSTFLRLFTLCSWLVCVVYERESPEHAACRVYMIIPICFKCRLGFYILEKKTVCIQMACHFYDSMIVLRDKCGNMQFTLKNWLLQ